MPASVSRRAFIQWLPDAPSEPTSTIVLTSPGGRFIDVRLLKTDDHDTTIDQAAIDWAFAGTSKSVKAGDEVTKQMRGIDLTPYQPFVERPQQPSEHEATHSTWTHTISSRTADMRGIADEGDMLFAPKLGLTLEQGSMAHPDTGRPTDYMEGWIDDDIGMGRCMVLQLNDTARQATGLVIHLDRWVQGVMRVGAAFSLQRWFLEDDGGHSLKLTAKYGKLPMPVTETAQANLSIGSKVNVEDSDNGSWSWEVVENADITS